MSCGSSTSPHFRHPGSLTPWSRLSPKPTRSEMTASSFPVCGTTAPPRLSHLTKRFAPGQPSFLQNLPFSFPFLGLPSYPVQILWSTLSHSLENVGSLPLCLLSWYLLRTPALPAPKPLPIVGKVKPGRWGPPETHVWALCCTHSWGSTPGKRRRLSAQSPPTARPGLSQALRTWSLDGLVC